ncbi:acetylornithine aminotransferase 1 [beta proteobacterium KB13]|uniref:Diaminobutyrate--2-oxoglutarate transaminase n=1 Tax=beta proteobacterium KB13 TaxID=314607 RepID=B6BUA7_9PROT|nr:acetylornithine aminotransferase 1 [beta proteobacterium KB13]
MESKYSILKTYGRLPISFEKGEGVWLFDKEGNKYLDALAGVAVNTLGHAHPHFTSGLKDQLDQFIHLSNYVNIGEQEKLAQRLASMTGMSAVFFSNSGCEANEAAIKFARLFANSKKVSDPQIIVMENSFHGRTMATLSATGSRKVQAGFEPLLKGFIRVPFDDLDSIKKIADQNKNVVAILVEPIQGEGGIRLPKNLSSYLNDLRKICDQNEWLLMLDEVQTGVGRTGRLYAFQYSDIKPDVLTSAKGLGSGVPIGATLVNEKIESIIKPGQHGSTFGGNPLACRAGNLTLDVLEQENLYLNATIQGSKIAHAVREQTKSLDFVIDVRHQGLMIGIELGYDCLELMTLALKYNLLISVTSGNVIRIVPPLVINDDESEFLVSNLTLMLKDYLKENKA